MKLIGFRSNKLWKKIVACIGYVLIGLTIMVSLTEPTFMDKVIAMIQYLSLGLPIILIFANVELLKQKLPLLNQENKIGRILGGVIWSFVFLIATAMIFFITVGVTSNFNSEQKKAQLERLSIEDKETKEKESIDKKKTETVKQNTDKKKDEKKEAPKPKKFELSAGMYKVGNELPAGEYILVSDGNSAYYSVCSDSTGDLGSIISNDNFKTNRYITVNEGEYVELKRCKLYKTSEYKLDMNDSKVLKNGMYKVGVDIQPGEYKVKANGSLAYLEVSTGEAGFSGIVTNDNFEGEKYITVSEGQYLKLSNNAELVK